MESRAPLVWSAAGILAATSLPWYALQESLDQASWWWGLWSSEEYAGGLAQFVAHGKWWLAPPLLALLACLAISLLPAGRKARGRALLIVAGAGIGLFVVQALAIGLRGWTAEWLAAVVGELDNRQVGMGAGATVVLVAL